MSREIGIVALLVLAGCVAEGAESTTASLTENVGVCGDYTTTLIAGRHMPAGSVSVSNDGTNAYVEITTEGRWELRAYHIYLGSGPVPMNRAGAPRPGHFPYAAGLGRGVTTTTVTIPLADIDAGCGDELTYAVHTVVGRGRVQQTAWAEGPFAFRRGWGSFDTYGVCCEPAEPTCTLPTNIWRERPSWWNLTSLDMGAQTYDADEMMSLLWTPIWGDSSIDLGWQYTAANLNLADGATMNEAENQALVDAAIWLDTYQDADGALPYGVYSIHLGYAEAVSLADQLEAWNAGNGSQPLCEWWY